MKITAIRQQVKNSERASIFVDGKYSFSLSLTELVQERLKNNEEIDGSRLKKLKKLSEDGKLRMRAMEWVMNRPRSIREFKDYMYRKKADEGLRDQLIEDFTARNYLNDENFARWLVDMRGRSGKSDRQIRAELFKKGIDRETVDQVLEEGESSEEERLRLVLAKKGNLPRYRNDPQKLAQYLTRQGFSWTIIKQVLRPNRTLD
jgi:regulatory protein